jgi:hypothetical protein
MEIGDLLSASGSYGGMAIGLAFTSILVSGVLALVKGLGNWVPAALWFTVPVLVLTLGAFGAAEAGQTALAGIQAASTADQAELARVEVPGLLASLAVGRLSGGMALLFLSMAATIGHLVGHARSERTDEERRQWVCARALIGATVLASAACFAAGVDALLWWHAWSTDLFTSGPPATPPELSATVRIGGLLFVAGGGALLLAILAPTWREVVRRRSLIGGLLCLLLVAGWGGAEAVAAVELARIEAHARPVVSEDAEEASPGEGGDPAGGLEADAPDGYSPP